VLPAERGCGGQQNRRHRANKLLVVRAAQGGLSTLVRTFERPMGLAVDGRRMALEAGPAESRATNV
jgi:hypothetical protein